MLIYLGLFLTAFATLALEVTLVRLLSVTTWYHLAFYAISTSMLGMTAGATKVFLHPEQFLPERLNATLAKNCLWFALSVPVALVILCVVPMGHYASFMVVPCMLFTTGACALPFFFGGIVVAAALTKNTLPIGKLYASDLVGAALGCLFVLFGLEFMDAPSLILLCGGVGALGGLCFGIAGESVTLSRLTACLAALLALVAVENSRTNRGIRPLIVKGTSIDSSDKYMFERWNSFSRIAVLPKQLSPPQLWDPSPKAPEQLCEQYSMNIDGLAGSTVREFKSLKDIEHLRYDLPNLAYYLRHGSACVIGIGGGRDLQSAILFGCTHVTGVEINPIFVDLLRHQFGEFAGLAGRSDVDIVTDEARSYLAHTDQKFSVIQMSLIDTWAATGAGAFSLSENTLYTVEGWQTFLNRLEDDGLFTVSRWHSPDDVGETARVVSIAMATLMKMGVQRPADHIAMVSANRVATLIVGRKPLTTEDVDKLRQVSQDLEFHVVFLPGQLPEGELLRKIISAETPEQIKTATDNAVLLCGPTTDENPYFFNMLRLKNIGSVMSRKEGVIRGNLSATLTLFALVCTLTVVAVAAIVAPLLLRSRFSRHMHAPAETLRAGIFYFCLIGAGFMFTEIALIQRLTVLLSHPMYALGILLFTLIASTGIGSFLSDRLPLGQRPWVFILPVLTAIAILVVGFALKSYITDLIPLSLRTRIAASILIISPLGVLMGMFFPMGMRLVRAVSSSETPWYWALNGVFGVLCSALAVFISINVGISFNFYIAAACYLLLVFAVAGLLPLRSESRAELKPRS